MRFATPPASRARVSSGLYECNDAQKEKARIIHDFIGALRFYHSEMHLRKQSDESSDEAAPCQARPCDAGLKRYKSCLDGKFHTITLPSSNGKKQDVASTLAPMMSDYKFAWHVHNFALIKKLPITMSEPHDCYSFLQQLPPDIDLEGFDFSHQELFFKRIRLDNGQFARGQPQKEHTAFFSATSSARAHIGGSALVSDVACLHITTIMCFERTEQSFQSSAGKHPDAHILQQ